MCAIGFTLFTRITIAFFSLDHACTGVFIYNLLKKKVGSHTKVVRCFSYALCGEGTLMTYHYDWRNETD